MNRFFHAMMIASLGFLALLASVVLPRPAHADPADISAAARGVVRVVIIGTDGRDVFPVSHGSGFAISPTRIVTNAHVVREAQQDDTMRIGIVPSDGDGAAFARIIAISPRNDLALVEIVGTTLRLPPLTISGADDQDGAEVSAVGYPMNVDRAQGLSLNDIFESQPAVKSRGFLSGARPSRQFDTILHTAPIARGNSGGPLLDSCGRVLGVNSFGADSDGSDAEFYFAVSNRELVPFLKANGINPPVNALPCRSLADIDEVERDRIEREQLSARQGMAQRADETREKRSRAEAEAEEAVTSERENRMAAAFLLMLVAFGAGAAAWQAHGAAGKERLVAIGGGIAAVAAVAALALWFTRPGLDEIDRRVAEAMQEDAANGGDDGNGSDGFGAGASTGPLVCTLDVDRSRITGTPDTQLQFDWAEDGCVNKRTQYGFSGGKWSRVFVPNSEAAVSVNIYDPATRTFRTDRYLLNRSAMNEARSARSGYSPPQCGTANAAGKLGDLQGGVLAALPSSPNERLIYSCAPENGHLTQ
ncbi:S1C family serine protease [Allopontixanthobacter confluentis]|nr:serine protease [Allopontixanthobacter confluentis]